MKRISYLKTSNYEANVDPLHSMFSYGPAVINTNMSNGTNSMRMFPLAFLYISTIGTPWLLFMYINQYRIKQTNSRVRGIV